MADPTLVFVSGPPGAGKTTLAHAIAPAIPCPVISRDEIKEGIVHTEGGETPEWGGPVSKRTFKTFYAVLRLMLESGVTVVAEGTFKRDLWEPDVRPLLELADMRIIRCRVDPSIARARFARRLTDDPRLRTAHPDDHILKMMDDGTMSLDEFDHLTLDDTPTLDVDTTDDYEPSLDRIIAFASR